MRRAPACVLAVLGAAAVPAHAQLAPAKFRSPITVQDVRIVYTVNADGTYTKDETAKVRVNTPQALRTQAQTYLPYDEALQRMQVLDAYTVTAAGKHVQVARNRIVTQQSPVSTNAPAFGDIKIKAIVFPHIAPGAIKVFHVRLTQKKPLFAHQFSMLQTFPDIVDVDYARITLIAPRGLPMHVQAIGLDGGPVKAREPGRSEWVWTLKNEKAGPPERGSVNPLDFSPRIAATTFASFAQAAQAYLAGAADRARVTPNVQLEADRITKGIHAPREQARALYRWVAGNIRYVALNFGLGGVVPRAAGKILAAGYGDCKDDVTLLSALLAAKGIKSHSVLVNASNVYWQPSVAIVPGVYNHAILYVPDFNLFVDPTAQVAPFGVLPIPELGKSALVTGGLDKDNGAGLETLPIASLKASRDEVVTKITIDAKGEAKGGSTMNATGPLEFMSRAFINSVPPGQEDTVADRLMAAFGQVGQGTLSASDPRDLGRDFRIETHFSIPHAVNLPGPGAMAVPLGVPSPLTLAGLARNVALPTRQHPMPCIPYDKTETTSLSLPAGLKITRLPRTVEVKNPIGSYRSTYTRKGSTVSVQRRLVMKPRGPLCTPAQYQQLRALGQAVGRDLQAQIFY